MFFWLECLYSMNTIYSGPSIGMVFLVFSIQNINTIETNVPNDFTKNLPKSAFGIFICFGHMIV